MRKFIEHNPIGKSEVDAVKKVVKKGNLSVIVWLAARPSMLKQ